MEKRDVQPVNMLLHCKAPVRNNLPPLGGRKGLGFARAPAHGLLVLALERQCRSSLFYGVSEPRRLRQNRVDKRVRPHEVISVDCVLCQPGACPFLVGRFAEPMDLLIFGYRLLKPSGVH